MSFLLNADGASRFTPGQTVQALRFQLNGKRIEVDGRVQYVGPSEALLPDESHRVGVEFTRIDSGDLFFLCDYVVRTAVETPVYFTPKLKFPKKKRAAKKKAQKSKKAKKAKKAKKTGKTRKTKKARPVSRRRKRGTSR
jgi:hypothetical protein